MRVKRAGLAAKYRQTAAGKHVLLPAYGLEHRPSEALTSQSFETDWVLFGRVLLQCLCYDYNFCTTDRKSFYPFMNIYTFVGVKG